MDKSFEKGCALIVGGSGGIGSLCAQEFANSGAKVAITFYKNELREYPFPRSLKGIEINARFRGLQSGLELAEAFRVERGILK